MADLGNAPSGGSAVAADTRISVSALALEGSSSQAAAAGSGGAAVEAGSTQLHVPNRKAVVSNYESKLQEARRWALLMGSVKAFSQFLAYCNLTWGTVALLGAFLPSLYSRDFAFITSLILLEAARLTFIAFFVSLLIRPLFYGSKDPSRMRHDRDGQYPLSLHARCYSHVLQSIFIFPSLAIPIVGLYLLDHHSLSDTRNLRVSLQIFYCLVAINSVMALVYLFFSLRAFAALQDGEEQSILRYFDTVLERAKSWGIVQADDFDFFLFAYTMLGKEFRRRVLPQAVAKNHKQLIQYLYAHAIGMDALEIYLDADDAFVRLAAVNVVGMWANTEWGTAMVGPGEALEVPEVILTKLADRVSLGELGWAVANCFGALASTTTTSGACLVENTFTGKNVSVVDSLAYVVDANRSRSLAPIRSLVRIYEQWWEDQRQRQRQHQHRRPLGDQEHPMLVAKLKKLGNEATLNRLRVQTAYLLLLMEELAEPAGRKLVEDIGIGNDKFWYRSEKEMLEVLRGRYHDLPRFEFPQDPNFLRTDARLRPPRWVISAT